MRYVSVTDTAKEIRKALKHNFPGVKFSVRSKSYSGGASIRVSWTDGPVGERVDKVVKRYEGAGFDAMQDLKTYHDDVISHEDGSVERVHWGSDYVFIERDTSPEVEEKIATDLAKVATDAIYLIDSVDHEFNAKDMREGHSLLLPVFVCKDSPEEGPYFAPISGTTNYASCLVREMALLLDFYPEKATA